MQYLLTYVCLPRKECSWSTIGLAPTPSIRSAALLPSL